MGRKLVRDYPTDARIFRYDRALALHRMGASQAARNVLEPLIADYCASLGIVESDLLMINGEGLTALFSYASGEGRMIVAPSDV